MKIEENKYFIFDNPCNSIKYFLKRCFYPFISAYYKVMLGMNRPKKVFSKKYYVSVCAIFKNEALYLKEWIEYHRIVGVDHFYLYNNYSEDDYKSVLRPYVDAGIVTIIEWPVKQGQMKAYEDCVKQYSSETNWIAFIDLDEFIVPNDKDTVKEVLIPFEGKRPVVIAYWKLFGTSGLMDRDINGLVIEDFFLCWPKYANIGKVFFNTAYDYAEDMKCNHDMHVRWARFKNKRLPAVNFYDRVIWSGINVADDGQPPIQINHYFTKSHNEYIKKMARGDAFFEINPRDEAYFYFHEMRCQSTDYNIRKYIIKVKKAMKILK